MADKGGDRGAAFSLKDHLFNEETLGQLAAEYAAGLPGFDAGAFLHQVLPGLPGRELMERIDWIADCLAPHLASDFPTMADQIEAAMPPPLDPTLRDDDFGQFIHAVPGVLAVRHGLSEAHLPRALRLLEAATQRFSMEFYIRPFLNAFPDAVMARLRDWTGHDNYHVRRLVSEGTRPTLPWAKRIDLDPIAMLPLLDALFADGTRFVTRSVANHLNDISKTAPDAVLGRLADWKARGVQKPGELAWMTKHALRTLIKQGHPGAMIALGYDPDAPVEVTQFDLDPASPMIGGTAQVVVALTAPEDCPVLVDYIIWFKRPGGRENAKVHKLKTGTVRPGETLTITKAHRFKGDATTYSLVPGPHRVALQVNGRICAETMIELLEP
jgi:3-methyladenine DNA glycosylase AlkC